MKKTISILAVAAIALAGCESMTETQQRTAIGTGLGALAGAALGSAVGGSGTATRNAAVLGAAAGGIGTYMWSKRMEEQKLAMQQATAGTGVGVTQTADNQLKLDIPSDISFDTGRADIKPNFRPILDRFAQTLSANPGTTVRIIGHTDSTGTDAVNEPLSVNRAASVRQYLADRGVSATRIAIDGRGSREPIADNATAAGRAQNRRVEIFVGEPQG
ncbi:OmpA family protein [Zeimonas arvi]|uniref:OmpA family protein n=1 Tax=Zeimonas arvi TaxID=2498847 RepID=A0A5C8P4B7_9BURK|nr:OmpA family protein [Zeimonas arvi]TXL68472.1 OmpA family protein [Zeimonas arvi]